MWIYHIVSSALYCDLNLRTYRSIWWDLYNCCCCCIRLDCLVWSYWRSLYLRLLGDYYCWSDWLLWLCGRDIYWCCWLYRLYGICWLYWFNRLDRLNRSNRNHRNLLPFTITLFQHYPTIPTNNPQTTQHSQNCQSQT